MIGARSGLLVGARVGLTAGISTGAGASMAGVTRDVASQKYTPANSTEWSSTMAVAGIASGGPSLLWLCQEPSGNLADSIGTFTGTVTGTPVTYAQAVTGWTRLGIAGGDAGTGIAASTAVGLPDPATTSMLILAYANVTATPAAVRQLGILGTTNVTTNRVNATPRYQAVSGGNVATGAAANPTGAAVHPFLMLYDVTGNRAVAYSDQEKLPTTRAATTGKRIGFVFDFPGALLYCAAFFGAAAELTDGQISTLLTTLGWTPAF